MNIIKWIKELFNSIPTKSEIDYFRKTGNIPMCGCDDFLETDDCKHIRKIRRQLKINLKKDRKLGTNLK